MSAPEQSPSAASSDAGYALPTLQPALATAVALVVVPVRAIAFWVAVLLPLSYGPLLATGAVGDHPLTFVGLLTLNVFAFVVGHGHNQPDAADGEATAV